MVKEMTGSVFGRWLVIGPIDTTKRNYRWFCRCVCGTESWVAGSALRAGTSKGCNSCRNTKHGHSINGDSTKEYNAHRICFSAVTTQITWVMPLPP